MRTRMRYHTEPIGSVFSVLLLQISECRRGVARVPLTRDLRSDTENGLGKLTLRYKDRPSRPSGSGPCGLCASLRILRFFYETHAHKASGPKGHATQQALLNSRHCRNMSDEEWRQVSWLMSLDLTTQIGRASCRERG